MDDLLWISLQANERQAEGETAENGEGVLGGIPARTTRNEHVKGLTNRRPCPKAGTCDRESLDSSTGTYTPTSLWHFTGFGASLELTPGANGVRGTGEMTHKTNIMTDLGNGAALMIATPAPQVAPLSGQAIMKGMK